MKKVYAALLSTTMVLGFAGVASAVHQETPSEQSPVVAKGGVVTLDGSVRMRGWMQKDAYDAEPSSADAIANPSRVNNAQSSGDTRGYDGRVRLGVTVKASDEVTGRILLENNKGSDVSAYENNYIWGVNGATGLHSGGTKGPGMEILEAWIQYVPGMGGLKVGHMPLALGNKLFFDHTGKGDDAIVAFVNPTSATHIAALTVKFEEGLENSLNLAKGGSLAPLAQSSLQDQSNDLDGYVALVTHKLNDAVNLGANWTYLHDSEGPTSTASGLSFHNIGLTADGTVGIISYKLDGEIQTGTLYSDGIPANDSDASGWAALGELSAKLDGGFTLGALIGYGTGTDPNATDNDNDGFVNFLSDSRYQSTMVGFRLAVPGMGGQKNTGLSNLQLYQINGGLNTTCPLTGKDLALKADVNYMKLNEVPNGMDDSIGTEIELFADWKLANGLTLGLEGAYLFADDAFKGVVTTVSPNVEVDNAWLARTTLNLSF